MKAVVAAFNQEKALVGAFSVITNLRMELFEALLVNVIITSLCRQAPEGDEVALTYTAGEAGYLAEGAALPLSPAVPEAPAVELPVMVALTPEVAEARDAFMATFEEVKMRAEAMEAEPEPEAVEAMERRRRDTEEAMVMEAAEMEDQVAMEDMAVEAVEGAAKFQVPPHTVCARGAAHCVR